MPSNHLILYCPLLLLPSIFPSIRVFSNESVLWFRWPKYWSFSFSISPSNEYSGLISFRIDWLDLLAVQGILKSLLQHHRYFSFPAHVHSFSLYGFKKKVIYLAVSGLNHITWDLLLWLMDSPVVLCGLTLLRGKWALSSLIRDRTCGLCIASWIPNPWTTREVPFKWI